MAGEGSSVPAVFDRSVPVVRLAGEDTVVAVIRAERVGSRLDAVRARLAVRYGGVLDDARVHSAVLADDVALLVVGGGGPVNADAVHVWGTAWAATGPATDAEVRAIVAEPVRARELTGRFVVVGRAAETIRLLTSTDVVHSLKHAEVDGVDAWATRGLAALTVVDRPVALNSSAIAEYLLFDFVLDGEELTSGVRQVEEATCIDIDIGRVRSASYWSRAERLAPGPPTTPVGLRAAITAAVVPVAAGEGAALGLTAGRDSLLVASCLADAGAAMAAFTMGDPSWPDAVGALAVCAALGWPHARTVPSVSARPSFAEAVRWSAWTEGLVLARDVIGPPLGGLASVRSVLSGSGGEIGRAVWWAGPAAAVGWRSSFVAPATAELAPAPAAHVGARVEAALASLPAADDARRLDQLYAFGRMRGWLARGRPLAGVAGTTAAYLSPGVVRALLDLPDDRRADASAFDEAIALGSRDLRGIAADAVSAARARRSLLRRARGHFFPPVSGEVATLELMLGQAGESLDAARAAVGDRFWDHARRTAATSTRSRLTLWNAVSLAALVVSET